MKKRKFNADSFAWVHSVRTKLTVAVSFLIAVISVFVYWFFPTHLEQQAMAAAAEKANSIATMMAYNISPALVSDDRPTVCDVVISAKHNPQVDYVMVLDDSARVIATFDSTRAIALNYVETDFAERISEDGLTYQTVAPIASHGAFLGRVYLGLSLEALNAEIEGSRETIALVSLCIGAFGILFVVTLNTLITKPLVKMVEAAEKISTGDWKQRATVSSRDEVGVLATAFNRMVSTLELAYDEVRESEKNYRNLFDLIPHPMWVFDRTTLAILEVNEAAILHYGYTRNEFLAMTIKDMRPSEEIPRLLDDLREQPTGSHKPGTWKHKKKDGTVVEVEITSRSLPFAEKNVTIVVASDITERRRAEESLSYERNMLRTMIDNIPDRIYVKDAQCRFLINNVAHVHALGAKSFEEAVGKTDFDFRPKEFATQCYQDDQSVITSGLSLNREEPSMLPTGERLWLSVTKVPLRDRTGAVVGLVGISRNITGRKQAEDALLLEKARFQQLFENAPIGIVLTDMNANIVNANGVFSEMFGYSSDELEGKNIHDAIVANDQLNEAEGIQGQTVAGKTFETETVRCRKDGTPVNVSLFGVPILMNGELQGVFGIYVDITERKLSEKALRESEERFRYLFAASPDAIILIDPQHPSWAIVDCNETACRMNGYLPGELIGQSIDVLNLTDVTPDERAAYLERLRQEGTINMEVLHRHKDGHVFPVEVCTSIVNFEGRELILGIDRDITQRKKVEEALQHERVLLRTVIDNIPDAIYVKDLECRKTVANLTDVRNMGLQSEADVLGKDDFMLFPKEIAENFFNDDKSVIESGNPVLNREEFFFDYSGHKRWLVTCKLPLRDEKGRIAGLVGIGHDITEKKNAEAQRNHLFTELEAANKDLNDFAYIISHDLKAPLRAIGSLVDWLVSDYGDKLGEEGNKMLKVLLGRTKRLHDLIEGVLKYSRIGKTKEETSMIELGKLVPEIVEMIDPPKNIEVIVEQNLPEVVGDKIRVQQVFQNLLSNAIKFMDKPKGEIRIGCERENGHWKFSVGDNGPGIEEKHFAKIFQIFQTLSARDDFESTGIGLTIVKKIVELNGGNVWVTSKVGVGTTFYFTLPAN